MYEDAIDKEERMDTKKGTIQEQMAKLMQTKKTKLAISIDITK